MMEFRVVDTVHSAFTVADLNKTLVLFRDFLGCEVLVQDHGAPEIVETLTGIKGAPCKLGFVRIPGGHMIEFIEYDGPNDRRDLKARPCDTGAAHIALAVDNLDRALAGAKTAGLELYNKVVTIDDKGMKGVRSAYFRAADGLTIELIQWNSAGDPFKRMPKQS
ncbi:MAG: bleomycin resistance protein [Alphaproteobacteria bacterium]|nr:bleomycin resistance protein [Alphaproteobacteria bacterium]